MPAAAGGGNCRRSAGSAGVFGQRAENCNPVEAAIDANKGFGI